MTQQLYNIYQENCPSRQVLELISNKWLILIVDLLAAKTYRFGDLKRAIGSISQKVLTERLFALERYGFVKRQDYGQLPLKVEYSLTDLGQKLSVIYAQITAWSYANIEEIIAAQKKMEASRVS